VITRKVFSLLSALMLATGVVQGMRGGWILAKARLAQVLLQGAWDQTREGGRDVKPWPWADSWPIARLVFPDGTGHIVLAGASGRNLAFAPGHLDGTARPGTDGTCVIAGHRDTHFADLDGLERGQMVMVEDAAKQIHDYRIVGAAVVDERETWVLTDNGVPSLVLITCWPLDSLTSGGRLRYVVWAKAES
jgi:sortase A